MSSTSIASREPDIASAQEILTRLERYVEAQRAALAEQTPDVAPAAPPAPGPPSIITDASVDASDEHLPRPRHRLHPATVDVFPYDLTASVAGCTATILAYVSFGRPIALGVTAVLFAIGAAMRSRRWFPTVGVNLFIGTVVGLIVVFTA